MGRKGGTKKGGRGDKLFLLNASEKVSKRRNGSQTFSLISGRRREKKGKRERREHGVSLQKQRSAIEGAGGDRKGEENMLNAIWEKGGIRVLYQ